MTFSFFESCGSTKRNRLEHQRLNDLVYVTVEKAERSDIPNIDKKKYLVPANLTIGQFVYVIRKRIKLSAEKAIFYLIYFDPSKVKILFFLIPFFLLLHVNNIILNTKHELCNIYVKFNYFFSKKNFGRSMHNYSNHSNITATMKFYISKYKFGR
ncbi:hypothetical protein K2173_013220 [Erythroxylum novogranatense]|uniref:Autophagy-related protein n=1 Tax=Erythroxylum novogranatense TaxID=1862640 RepID=A0AAV8SC87_9ROSI|nr:hypothetical protein K2173_013220 [Erythroxylum novogranatense]